MGSLCNLLHALHVTLQTTIYLQLLRRKFYQTQQEGRDISHFIYGLGLIIQSMCVVAFIS